MKVKYVGTLEAKTRLSHLLAEVQKGQRFYLTKHGKPVAELSPVHQPARRPAPGFAKGTFSWIATDFDAPLEDFAEYMK